MSSDVTKNQIYLNIFKVMQCPRPGPAYYSKNENHLLRERQVN